MGSRRPLTAACRVLVAVALATVAAGAESGRVLVAGSCMPPGARADDVILILAAELAPLHIEPLTPMNVDGRVAVLGIESCNAMPPGAKISVWRDGERRERTVLLADVASGTESRTLALALAEALRDPSVTRAVPGAPPPWPEPPREPPVRAPVLPSPDAQEPPATPPSSNLAARTGLLFRFLPSSSTPALGATGQVVVDRIAMGLVLLASRKSGDIGTANLVAITSAVTLDAIALSSTTFVRIGGEVGAAIGIGSPAPSAVGHTHAAPHVAILGGLAQRTRLFSGCDLELFISGGYASSLNADADGHRIAGLSGGLVSVEAAVRF